MKTNHSHKVSAFVLASLIHVMPIKDQIGDDSKDRGYNLNSIFTRYTIRFTGHISFADVNLKSGSIVDEVSALKSAPDFKLIYRSRSYHQGLFGYGWCSVLDDRLQIEANNNLQSRTKQNILASTPITASAPDSIQWTSCTEGQRFNLLKKSDQLWSLSIPTLKATYTIKKNGQVYEFSKNDQLLRKYNMQGQLIWLKHGTSEWSLQYSPLKKLISFKIGKQKYNVRQNANQEMITEIFNVVDSPRSDQDSAKDSTPVLTKESVKFTYENSALTKIASGNKKYEFKYDQNLNRVSKWLNDQRLEKVTYDDSSDRVTEYYNAKKCLSKLSYTPLTPTRFNTRLVKRCLDQREVLQIDLSSEYKLVDGQKQIHRLLVTKKVTTPTVRLPAVSTPRVNTNAATNGGSHEF